MKQIPICHPPAQYFKIVGLAILSLLAVHLASRDAHAGPPFITDDPEPVEKGHGEVYLATQNTWARDGVNGTLPHVEFNYGPIENTQLHIIAPVVYDRPNANNTMEYGYGDTELGVKYRFLDEDKLFNGSPEIGIFPLLEVPTGDHNRGLGNGRTTAFLPVWFQKSWGEENRKWTTYGGGGYWINPGPGNNNYGFVGIVLQRQLTDHLTLGGEIFHSTSPGDTEPSHTTFNLGGQYDFSEHWHLLFSIGRDFHGNNLLTSYTAIQYTF